MDSKNVFGKQFLTVKDNLLMTCFQFDDEAKVSFSVGLLGKVVDDAETANGAQVEEFSADDKKFNVQMLDVAERCFLAENEPLMTIDGKQRVLPKGVLVCSLADDKSEFKQALEKLARILRNSAQLRESVNSLRFRAGA